MLIAAGMGDSGSSAAITIEQTKMHLQPWGIAPSPRTRHGDVISACLLGARVDLERRTANGTWAA